ncbi:MAG TPA: adenylate/guanylate cyclase domain-containing protein [Methylomirabilota bacterium]|nr:adenylate/guanylate cyclase domain-containing protein [Methylomirabilota bacterium]
MAALRSPAPETYTPRHLAEKILTSKAALEGERKHVTVLFADLKGSMELLADRDPEEARRLLDPVLERMMEAVHLYEGTVNQVMGDGIMALFGAPLAHEDHAVRACYAALRMQELVKRYAEDARRTQGVNVQIRVGLNSGEVVVRAIGSDLHMDYTAVGQTTHLAARMEQLASPGSILLPASTLELVKGYVAVTALGPIPVKGLAAAVEVYEVTGAGPARTRLQASAWRGLTRFVGRGAELEALRRAQQLAGSGHGQVVAAVGEAGVGKSRLIYEFIHSHRLKDWLVLEATSLSYGRGASYLAVADLLKRYFQIEARDDKRRIREKVTGKLLSLDLALDLSLPALLALLDVPDEGEQWMRLEAAERRRWTLDSVRRLLLRQSQLQPLLVVFEDLHWADSETQALLADLVEKLPGARILVLLSYRPEYTHGWGGKTYYSQVRVDPLASTNVEELLHALFGGDAALEGLKRLLIDRTDGNPFFLEESVRTLAETKALVGEPGEYRLTTPIQTIQVPASVQAILASRIDRLPSDEKRLLQAAAVIGTSVPFALLQAIVELPETELHRCLAHLQSAELLHETSLFPDLEYTFRHALTHEVTYGSLLQERRRELHAGVVAAIERLHRDRRAEHVEVLAYHALRGGLWDRAVTYLREGSIRAAGRSAYREALTSFEEALRVLARLPVSREATARPSTSGSTRERCSPRSVSTGGSWTTCARLKPWRESSVTGAVWAWSWPTSERDCGTWVTMSGPSMRADRSSISPPSWRTRGSRSRRSIVWLRHISPSATCRRPPSSSWKPFILSRTRAWSVEPRCPRFSRLGLGRGSGWRSRISVASPRRSTTPRVRSGSPREQTTHTPWSRHMAHSAASVSNGGTCRAPCACSSRE